MGPLFGLALVGLLLGTVVAGDSDGGLYRHYALAFWTRSPLGHSLPAEYPPLSVLVFSLSLLPPGPAASAVFGAWMGTLALLLYWVTARLGSPRQAATLAVYLVLCGVGTLVGRFDLVPAALTLAVFWLAKRSRFGLAYAMLAVAILLKLYPAVLVPVVAIEQARHLRRAGASRRRATLEAGAGMVVVAGIVAATLLGARWLAGPGWAGAFTYLAGRPVQVESTPASLMWLASLAGMPLHPAGGFGSFNVSGAAAPVSSAIGDIGLLLGLPLVYWARLRGWLPLGRTMLLAVVLVVATSRVESTQYMIWIAVLAAVDEPFSPAWAVVFLLSSVIYPVGYALAGMDSTQPIPPAYPWGLMAIIALRNGLLVATALSGSLTRSALPARVDQ